MSDVDISSLVSSEVTPPTASSRSSEQPLKQQPVMVKKEPGTFDPATTSTQRISVQPRFANAGGVFRGIPRNHALGSRPAQVVKADRTPDGQSKMVLGQTALAGIVISSGPDGHFETYEGKMFSQVFSLLLKNSTWFWNPLSLNILLHFLIFLLSVVEHESCDKTLTQPAVSTATDSDSFSTETASATTSSSSEASACKY